MKKTAMLLAVVFLLSIGVFAQTKPDYSGEWTLDVSKSKLDERARIESMTVKAAQTATDIKVETDTKRTPPPNGGGQGGGMPGGGGGQGGGGRMGGMGGGNGAMTYTLDGKETTVEVEGRNGTKMPVKMMGSFEGDGKLDLSSSRTFTTPNGDITSTTKDVWSLSDGGKTLTISRTLTSPMGDVTSTMVFTKK